MRRGQTEKNFYAKKRFKCNSPGKNADMTGQAQERRDYFKASGATAADLSHYFSQ